jgi:hypothetical protein
MSWIPFVYVLVGTVVSIVWMGLALGAVLNKMGMDSSRAWIPVMRWVAAAEAGRTSRLAVLIARSVSAAGIAILLVALALRGIQGTDISRPVALLTLAGGLLYGIGAFVGWIFWIIGAGTIGMRLNIGRGWTVLAALSPNLWAAIVGWANIGTPIPSDAIGRAASAGASSRSLTDAPPPTGAPAGSSIFGAGRSPAESLDEGFNTAPFATSDANAVRSASAWPTVAGDPAEAQPADAQPAAFPAASTTAPETPAHDSAPSAPQFPSAPAASEVPAASETPVAAEADAAPIAPAGIPAVPDVAAVPDVPAPPVAAPPTVNQAETASAPPLADAPASPAFIDAPPPSAPPAVDPNRPVSPYITAAIPQVPASIADAFGDAPIVRPEAEDDETVIEKIAPVPPATEPAPPAAPAPGEDTRISMLPPGWAQQDQQSKPAAAAESAAPLTPPPSALPPASPPARAEEPAPAVIDSVPSAAKADDDAEPAAVTADPEPFEKPEPFEPVERDTAGQESPEPVVLEPTPPPARPTPAGVWAPRSSELPQSDSAPAAAPTAVPPEPAPPISATPPPTPPAPAAAATDSDGDDHTVVAQRRRDVWVLEVIGGDSYPLPEGDVSIGRAAALNTDANHVGVNDTTRTMSKRHAKLRLVNGEWKVSDLGSTNGTFVRGQDGREVEIAPGHEAAVDGALLLGDLEARIVNQGSGRS